MGIEIPEKYGGTGSSFLAACLAVEEMAKVDASVAVCVDVQNTLVNNVFTMWANEDIKARAFPRLAKDTVASFCLSEPGSGSDAFALRTRADKKGDYYVINGQKLWITNAAEAGIFLIMANVDPSKGYKGITCFMADSSMPGLTVGKVRPPAPVCAGAGRRAFAATLTAPTPPHTPYHCRRRTSWASARRPPAPSRLTT